MGSFDLELNEDEDAKLEFDVTDAVRFIAIGIAIELALVTTGGGAVVVAVTVVVVFVVVDT